MSVMFIFVSQYWLHTEYKNIHSTSILTSSEYIQGRKDILAGPHIFRGLFKV